MDTRLSGRALPCLLLALAATAATPLRAASPRDNPPDMFGVNLSAAGFGGVYPGTHGTHYIYPDPSYLDYYKARGIELIRFPIRWERIQRTLNGPLDATELARLDALFDAVEERGMRIIIDVHNYARYSMSGTAHLIGSTEVPRSAFQDLWERLAAHFEHRDCLWGYGIMNEPYGVGSYTWKDTAQYAVDGIRQHDTRHAILIPGDVYSSASNWTAYSANLIDIVDPEDHLIYEAHCYFDNDSSGTYDASYDVEGATAMTGVNRLGNFVNWCNANGVRGFVGEYGVPDNDARWNTVLDNALDYLRDNGVSGTYWAAGPMWADYPLRTEPRKGHDEAPQMAVLTTYGDGPGTRFWPAYTWYKDGVSSGLGGSYTYDYKSASATLAANFADINSAHYNSAYAGRTGVTLAYTIPSGGYAGGGMHINGGINLATNFARGHSIAFYIKGSAGASVKLYFVDENDVESARVDTAGYVTTSGSWQQVRIPLSAFVTGSFDGSARIERIAFDALPADNVARTVRLDTFVIEKSDFTAPTATVATTDSGTSYPIGVTIGAVATASDSGGAVDFVEFLLNGRRVGTDATAPYACDFVLPDGGDYRLTAIAYDMQGNPGRSTPVNLTGVAPAGAIELTASDTWSQSSFNSALHWSDAIAPRAGVDYLVDGLDLRTPGNTSSYTFQGDSLRLQNGGRLVLRTTSAGVVTVDDLRADDGGLSLALNGAFTLAGGVTVETGGLEVVSGSSGRSLMIASQVSGPGALTVSLAGASDHLTLTNAANTFSGGSIVSVGQLRVRADHALGTGDVVVAAGASLDFASGATHDYIDNGAVVVLAATASADLDFNGTDIVAELSLDGGVTYAAIGTWGAPGSGAAHTSSRFTGTGLLHVVGASAVYVDLISSDAWEQTGFTSGARWSDGLAPHAGADYVVDGLDLRTPGNSSSHTFGGDALLLQDGGRLVMRTTGSGVVTVGDLYADDGVITLALNSGFNLAGGLSLQPGGLTVSSGTSGRTLTIASLINGNGGLTASLASGSDHLTLTNSGNTHTGGTTVTVGTLRAQAVGALGTGAVVVASTATLNLDYTGTATVSALSLDGGSTYVSPGVWGAVGSGAANTSSRITGTGLIQPTGTTP